MNIRKNVVALAVIIPLSMIGVGATVAPASAHSCWLEDKGRVCLNGFDPGDKGNTQFTGVLNSYNMPVLYSVTGPYGGIDHHCIKSGKIRWYDNAISSVKLGTWENAPVRCNPDDF